MYRYYCIMRPPKNDWLPHTILEEESFEERRYIPDIDRMVWGWVEYAFELTMQEVANYELIMQPREDE